MDFEKKSFEYYLMYLILDQIWCIESNNNYRLFWNVAVKLSENKISILQNNLSFSSFLHILSGIGYLL